MSWFIEGHPGRKEGNLFPAFLLVWSVSDTNLHLVVGLGNPGEKYALTRHNIGFQFLDFLASRNRLFFSSSKWQAQTVRAGLWGQAVLLAKPETYMNLSGQAVAALAGFYRVPVERILVIHDDIDLEVGRVRIVKSRGAGGHNGIRSLIEHLGDRAFVRIRVGVGRPPGPMPVEHYVLSRFSPEESAQLQAVMERIEAGLRLILMEGPVVAMNAVNAER